MKNVKLTKIGETKKGEYPVGYWVKGQLIKDIEEKQIISIIRTSNSEGNRLGLFTSSPVHFFSVDPESEVITIHTENSTYLLEFLLDN